MKRVCLMMLVVMGSVYGQEGMEDIRGAKPLIEIPVVEEAVSWLVYAGVGVAVLLLVGGLIWWLGRKRAVAVSSEQKAIRELGELEKRGVDLAAGDFALAASGIVRVFIERRFGLAAPKRTTEEFLSELSRGKDTSLRSHAEPLRNFLKSCDMAKFAGKNLGASERGDLVSKARAFVESPVREEFNEKEAG